MRLAVAAFALVAFTPQTGAADDYEAVAVQAAIASVCRAKYGEDDLFDVAFQRLVDAADRAGSATAADLAQARAEMMAIEDDGQENLFARGFCDLLRQQIMP